MLYLAAANAQTGAVADSLGKPPGSPVRSDYVLGPDDELKIRTSEMEEVERTIRIPDHGRILLPVIGEVQAAGRTLLELQRTWPRAIAGLSDVRKSRSKLKSSEANQ